MCSAVRDFELKLCHVICPQSATWKTAELLLLSREETNERTKPKELARLE